MLNIIFACQYGSHVYKPTQLKTLWFQSLVFVTAWLVCLNQVYSIMVFTLNFFILYYSWNSTQWTPLIWTSVAECEVGFEKKVIKYRMYIQTYYYRANSKSSTILYYWTYLQKTFIVWNEIQICIVCKNFN